MAFFEKSTVRFFSRKLFIASIIAGTVFGGLIQNVSAALTNEQCIAQGGACERLVGRTARCNNTTQNDLGDCTLLSGAPGACCAPKESGSATGTGTGTSAGAACNVANCQNSACSASQTPDVSCQISVCSSGQYYCTSSTATSTSSQSIEFANPLQYDTVEEVLNSLLGTLQGIIVILSLVFIVIGAVLYITSAGNDKQMGTAKGAITAAMIGLAIGLAAPSFLKEIGQVLGWGAVESSAVAGARTLTEIATSVLQFLLSIVGILAIIMLVVGGIMYLTAAGDEDRIDTGKKIVQYSIIGIAIALASLVIVSQIAEFFV